MSINICAISGNLTRDAEVKHLASGNPVVNFTVAVNENRRITRDDGTVDYENYANFINLSWFGKYAEKVAESMKKGTLVSVQGRLHMDRWEKDGETRTQIKIIADSVQMPPRNKTQATTPATTSAPVTAPEDDAILGDDDTPF